MVMALAAGDSLLLMAVVGEGEAGHHSSEEREEKVERVEKEERVEKVEKVEKEWKKSDNLKIWWRRGRRDITHRRGGWRRRRGRTEEKSKVDLGFSYLELLGGAS